MDIPYDIWCLNVCVCECIFGRAEQARKLWYICNMPEIVLLSSNPQIQAHLVVDIINLNLEV